MNIFIFLSKYFFDSLWFVFGKTIRPLLWYRLIGSNNLRYETAPDTRSSYSGFSVSISGLPSSYPDADSVSSNSAMIEIRVEFCTVRNCHNCARSISYGLANRHTQIICTSMLQQKGCCDFTIV